MGTKKSLFLKQNFCLRSYQTVSESKQEQVQFCLPWKWAVVQCGESGGETPCMLFGDHGIPHFQASLIFAYVL